MKLTNEQIAEAKRMWDEGASVRQLAPSFGVAPATIRIAFRRLGLKHTPKFQKLSLAEAITQYESGKSVYEVADIHHISASYLYSILKESGVAIRDASASKMGRPNIKERALNEEQEQEVCRLYLAGEVQSDIAKHFKVSPEVVYGIRKRNNLPTQPRRYFSNFSTRSLLYSSPTGRRCAFRSSWEVAFAAYFDQHGTDWAYESHSFVLSDGRIFIPDFWIPDWGVFVEIKGYMRNDAQDKIDLFREEYPDRRLLLLTREALDFYGMRIGKGGRLELLAA